MAFTVPDEATAAANFSAKQSILSSADLSMLANAAGKVVANYAGPTGVEEGCAVTQDTGSNMNVAVAAGVVRIGGRKVTVGAGTVAVTSTTSDRWALITVNTSGTKAATNGTAGTDPTIVEEGSWPSNCVVLAAVFIPANDTAITSAQIVDKRIFVPRPEWENIEWYGALVGANNTTAIQAAIDALPTSYPIRGGIVFIPTGVWDTGALTIPPLVAITFMGVGSPKNGENCGSILSANANNVTIITMDGTVSGLLQTGPTFMNMGFRGGLGTYTGTTGVYLKTVNHGRFYNVSFDLCASYGLRLNSNVAANAANDSAWHGITDCHWYQNAVGVFCDHSYGFTLLGGDVLMAAGQTGAQIKNEASNNIISQVCRIIGTKFDGPGKGAGNGTGIDCEGAISTFSECCFEGLDVGIKLTKTTTGTAPAGGESNRVEACTFGSVVTGVNIGTGCVTTQLSNLQMYNVTTPVTDAGTDTEYEATGRRGYNPSLYRGTATYDPISLAAGASVDTTVTVTGAVVGMPAIAAHASYTNAAIWTTTATVSSANTVRVRITNNTAGTVDLASGTLTAVVFG